MAGVLKDDGCARCHGTLQGNLVGCTNDDVKS